MSMGKRITLDLSEYEELKKKADALCIIEVSEAHHSEYGMDMSHYSVVVDRKKGDKKTQINEEIKKTIDQYNNNQNSIKGMAKMIAKREDEIKSIKNRSLFRRILNRDK